MSKRKPSIDEDEMCRILGREGPLLDAPPAGSVLPSETKAAATASLSTEEPAGDTRRKRMVVLDFEDTFLKPLDIRNRSALYVRGETKRKVLEVVRMIGSDPMTATSYLENILLHHLALYRDDINRLYQERISDKLL